MMARTMRGLSRLLCMLALGAVLLGAASPAWADTTYVVQPGDSLGKIALKFGVSVDALVEANNLANPNFLYVGQTLTIPDGAAAQAAASADSTTYTVRAGDSLGMIAQRLGLSLSAIISANPGITPDRIYVGQVLKLPGASAAPAVSQPAATGSSVYQVKAGDTLSWIAQRYETTVQALKDANSLKGDIIYVGQTLAIPGQAQAAPAASPAAASPGAYPYLSGVTAHAVQIFQAGKAAGNRPNVFSKVGDSITVSNDFLTRIAPGMGSLYEYEYLRPAVDYFGTENARLGNSFANVSLAAGNGWTAWAALDGLYHHNAACLAGESPLHCEYRLVRPSVALIMFGTNDAAADTQVGFRGNLTQIVQQSVEMGVIPVLSTIPARIRPDEPAGRVAEYNQIIVETARALDVPLWDYNASIAALPNQGLSADGIHPSSPPGGGVTDFTADHLQYGFTVRNLGALQVLQALLQQVISSH